MAGFSGLDLCLLITVIIVVIVDIILAICVGFILPKHVTSPGKWYPANGKDYEMAEAKEYCKCLNAIFPRPDDDRKITFDKPPEHSKKKRSVRSDFQLGMNQYSYLVSLSAPAYSDDPSTKIFACNGLALSPDILLTTRSCVVDESEWYNLTVRSLSPFWSKNGKTHSIIDYKPGKYQHFMELKVDPPFSDKVVSNIPITLVSSNDNWTYAVSLGWDRKYKHKIFTVFDWTSTIYPAENSTICYKTDENCEISSRPLITSCLQVIGVQVSGGMDCQGFLGTNGNKHGEGEECRDIYKDDGFLTEKEVCHFDK